MTMWNIINLCKRYLEQRASFITLVDFCRNLEVPTLQVGELTEDRVQIKLLGKTYFLVHTLNIPEKDTRDSTTGTITRYLVDPFDSRIAQKKNHVTLENHGIISTPSEQFPDRTDKYRVSETEDLDALFPVLFDVSKDRVPDPAPTK